jgi:hypothetical protein
MQRTAWAWNFGASRIGVDFDAALTLLDQYLWHLLSPLQVHPDFRQQVWAAVEERFRTDKHGEDFGSPDRWRRLCHVEAD